MLAKDEAGIDAPEFYDGKIYYSTDIVENVTYKTIQDEKEQIMEEEETVGIRLNRMEPDGTSSGLPDEYRWQRAKEDRADSEGMTKAWWIAMPLL